MAKILSSYKGDKKFEKPGNSWGYSWQAEKMTNAQLLPALLGVIFLLVAIERKYTKVEKI